MDCSLPGSSVHWIFQARVLEWGAIAFSAAGRGPWFETQLFHHVSCHWLRQVAFSKDCSELSCPRYSSRMWPFPQQEAGFTFPPLKGGWACEHCGSDVLCYPRPGRGGNEASVFLAAPATPELCAAMGAAKRSETVMLWGSPKTACKGPETTRRDAWLTPCGCSLLVLTLLFPPSPTVKRTAAWVSPNQNCPDKPFLNSWPTDTIKNDCCVGPPSTGMICCAVITRTSGKLPSLCLLPHL